MGFIYLLYNDAGYGYIGQTSRSMSIRISHHKHKSNTCKSKILGEFEWLVLEEVPNEDLQDFERYYYDIYNEMFPDMLVNKCVPLRTEKEHNEANKEKRLARQRVYNEANKEKLSTKMRIYREVNKEKIAEYRRDYHNKRKLITN